MATRVLWFAGREGPPDRLPPLRDATVVARSRTTLTERGTLDLPSGPVAVHRKTYRYEGAGALLAGMFRTTFLARGRARREAEALLRLRALGLAPAPLALLERRTAGFLREAILAVATVEGGEDLDRVAPSPDLAAALGRAAGRMHAAGLGDLSMAPRNFVAARGAGGWTVAKVDSGRMRPAERGGPVQAADLADLLAGLEGRWGAAEREALLAAYAEAAGALPAGLEAAAAAARARAARRYSPPGRSSE